MRKMLISNHNNCRSNTEKRVQQSSLSSSINIKHGRVNKFILNRPKFSILKETCTSAGMGSGPLWIMGLDLDSKIAVCEEKCCNKQYFILTNPKRNYLKGLSITISSDTEGAIVKTQPIFEFYGVQVFFHIKKAKE